MEESAVAGEEPGCFARATKSSRDTIEDTLLNTRGSGGGEIKESNLKLEGGDDIPLMTMEAAEPVAQKENLALDGAQLTTTVMTFSNNLPADKRRVHVRAISDKTTKDELMTYMEMISGEEVESVFFGDACNAMVIFKDPPDDFEKLSNLCRKKPLDEKILDIEQVNICDCIEVTGFSPETTKDGILYYFENRRNKGGDVRKMEYDEEERRAVIFFDDPSVVDNVMKQDHVIDGADLMINRHYTFLGKISSTNPSGGKKDRVIEVNPNNMILINEFFCQEFDQLLQERRVKYTWHQGSREIVLGCTEPKMYKKTWENCCEAVVAYINQIVTEKITISREIWEQISDAVKEKCAVFESQISIQYVFDLRKKENSIVLRGKETDVHSLTRQMQDLVSRVEKKIMIEKSKISKKIELPDMQMELLSFTGFVDGLKTSYKGLEVTLISDSSSQVIQLRGLEEEVNECTAFVWQTLSRVKESEMKFSKSVVSVLGSDEGKAFMSTCFKNNSIEAVIGLDSTSHSHIVVMGIGRDQINTAVDFIKNAIAEESIPLDTDQKQLVESEKWKELKHSIPQRVLLQVTEKQDTSVLLLVGIKEEIDMAKERVKEFFDTAKKEVERLFQENLVSLKVKEFEKKKIVKIISLTDAQLKLLKRIEFVGDLQEKFEDIQVKFSKKDGTINFRGPDTVMRDASHCLWQTLAKVKEVEIKLPSSVVYVVSSDAGKVLMATKFKNENIDAVVDRNPSNPDSEIIVTAVDQKDAKKAVELIKDLISEQSIPLEHHRKELINSEKWKELKISIRQSMLLQVREEPASSILWIAGIKEEVDKGKEKVDGFFKENIILDHDIKTENGRVKFIIRYRKDAIDSMEKSLANQFVNITKKTDEEDEACAVVVSGTRDGIQEAGSRVEKLLKEIKERKVDLVKPGMEKLFSKKEGMTLLSKVEKEHDCIIQRCTPSRATINYLQVYAASDENLTKAEKDIYKLITENSKIKEIEHKAIGKLSDSQLDRVMRMEVTHHTKIKIDKRINRIVIRGVAEDVSNATVAVYDILNKMT